MRRSIRGVPRVFLAAAVLSGCDAITGSPKPKVELTPSATTANVGQGSSVTVPIAIKRTKFDKTVTVTVEGAPPGVTAFVSPSSVEKATPSVNLQITASGSAIPGKTTLTVRAKGEGIAEQTVPLEVTVTATGSFTVSSVDPALSVAQGGGGTSTIRIVRSGGNASSVDLAATGLPPGITASFVTAPTTTSVATMVLSASASVATGSYPITITATSPGFPNQTTTVTVTVVGAPSMASLTLSFCVTDFPIWVAYQNEGFAWKQATLTGTAFTFDATNRLGVALVFQRGNQTVADIFYATRTELSVMTNRDCGGTKSLSGSVAGLGTNQVAKVAMGVSLATPSTNTSYTLPNVNARALDLVASRGTTSGPVDAPFFAADRVIIRRDVDLASGASIPALDFAGSEAVATVSTTLNVTGAEAADSIEMQNTFWSRTSTFNGLQSAALKTTASATVPSSTLLSVPASSMVSGDTHELFVDAFQESSTLIIGHAYALYSSAPANQTVTLGPRQNTPTMSIVTSTPYSRIRGVVASQGEYDTSVRFGYFQGQQSAGRNVNVTVSAAYLGGTPASWDVTIPDFAGTAAFNVNWMPASGQPTSFYVEAFSGRTEVILGAQPVAGDLVRFAYRAAALSITTLARGAGEGASMSRPGYRRGPQYLRR